MSNLVFEFCWSCGDLAGFGGFNTVEAFGGRELGRLDAALDHASLAIDQLQFNQSRKEPDVIQPLGSALARNLLILAQ